MGEEGGGRGYDEVLLEKIKSQSMKEGFIKFQL